MCCVLVSYFQLFISLNVDCNGLPMAKMQMCSKWMAWCEVVEETEKPLPALVFCFMQLNMLQKLFQGPEGRNSQNQKYGECWSLNSVANPWTGLKMYDSAECMVGMFSTQKILSPCNLEPTASESSSSFRLTLSMSRAYPTCHPVELDLRAAGRPGAVVPQLGWAWVL